MILSNATSGAASTDRARRRRIAVARFVAQHADAVAQDALDDRLG